MKIVSVSTSDLGHGAGIAAYRLHCALRNAGHDATMLVSEKLSDDSSVIDLLPALPNVFLRMMRKTALVSERLLNVMGPQNFYSVVDSAVLEHIKSLKPEIIHLHNIHWHSRNLSITLPMRLGRIAPLVWTYHDMWPITGHCIYSRDCDRWHVLCGNCPYVRAYLGLLADTSRFQCLLKRRIYANSRFAIVTPSQWLADCAKVSPLITQHEIRTIPNSIDLSIFSQRDKTNCKRIIGFKDLNKPVLLFVAAHLDNSLKGYSYFEKCLMNLSTEVHGKLNVIIVGQGVVANRLKEKCSVIKLGYVVDQNQMADIYSAADIFVMPSLYDNLPSVVLESLACGTPVVCFNTGGIPEMVQHGVTGYVARYRDDDDLTRWMEIILMNHALRTEMGKAARQLVEKEYSPFVQANRYLALYQEILLRHAR